MFPDGGCLYGEGYGAKIQKGGGNYRPDGILSFRCERRRAGGWNVGTEDVAGELDLDVVPIIGRGTLYDMVARAKCGFVSTWAHTTAFMAEGIVARPSVELRDRAGHRIITKIKQKDVAQGIVTEGGDAASGSGERAN